VESNWIEAELGSVYFGDTRLRDRLISIGSDMLKKIGGAIPQICTSSAATKGAYRFFANEKVSMEAISEPHIVATLARAKQYPLVLNIQDTSSLNFAGHDAMFDRGHIGSASSRADANGYFLHTGLLVSPNGIPLGLMYEEIWARLEVNKGKTKDNRKSRLRSIPIEEKESFRWIEGISSCRPLVEQGIEVVQVADREADIFEFMHACIEEEDNSFVIRAKSDRVIEIVNKNGAQKTRLKEHLDGQPVKFHGTISIASNGSREKQNAKVKVKSSRVAIAVPTSNRTSTSASKLVPIEVTAILVESSAKVNGNKVKWLLLTDRIVTEEAEILEIISWYTVRWTIEIFFKVLKSGCEIEKCCLTDLDRFAPYAMMKTIVAFRVMELTYFSRNLSKASAFEIITMDEWKVISLILYKKNERKPKNPKIGDLIRRIAEYGGFLRGKKRVPGIITIWRGWIGLNHCFNAVEALNNKRSGTCG